jgi:ubiquinol-cytochrome c reductase cytochrome b subunit
VFLATKRICLGLQHRDRDKLLHGRETGIIRRLPSGEFVEIHAPIPDEERHTILQAGQMRPEPVALPAAVDDNGVPAPGGRKAALRAKLSAWFYAESVLTPSDEELHHAAHHAQELLEDQQRQLDAYNAGQQGEPLDASAETDTREVTSGH